MRRNSVGWNDASADHINRKHAKMVEQQRGKSPAQAVLDSGVVTTIHRMADEMEAAIGNDVTHMVGNGIEIEGAANPQHVADFFADRRREKFLDAFYGELPRPGEPLITFDAYLRSTLGIQALLVATTNPKRVGFWL